MADDIQKPHKPRKPREKPLKDIPLSPRGQEVGEYLYNLRQYIIQDTENKEPSLNFVEKTAIQATTGIRIKGPVPLEVSILPFGARNPLIVDYESKHPVVGDRFVKAQVGFGKHVPTLNQLSLYKEQQDNFSEFGLMAPRDGRGPSVVGNSNPKPPVLRDKLISAGVGVSGGLGYRERALVDTQALGRISIEMQAAIVPDNNYIQQPTKPAPSTAISVSQTGQFAGNEYLVGTSIFKGKGNIGGSITAAAQRKLDESNTVNVYGEVVGGDANIKRIGAEVSHHMPSIDSSVYVRADITKASGRNYPSGITEGTVKTASLGIAKDLSKDVRGFIEVTKASDLKSPTVQIGLTTSTFSAVRGYK